MSEGPDIARVAALIGDAARAKMLSSLMQGRALTASELAIVAGVTPATASSHLSKLETGGLLVQRKQGRHRYFSLSGDSVIGLLTTLQDLARGFGHMQSEAPAKDPALVAARQCYNHLAGERGVQMFESMRARHLITDKAAPELTKAGVDFVTGLGVEMADLYRGRAPMCRLCLDWSDQKVHLAGALGRALLSVILDRGWATLAADGSRTITFSEQGAAEFDKVFPTQAAKNRPETA